MNNCHNCNKETPNAKFCSCKCAGAHINIGRKPRTEESKKKTSNSLCGVKHSPERVSKAREAKGTHICSKCNTNHPRRKSCEKRKSPTNKTRSLRFDKSEVGGEFTKIYYCKCKFCKCIFIETSTKQICGKCISISSMKNAQYRFKFNIFDYPNLFNLSLIEKYGFVSFGGKRGGILNHNGISRDHKISVSDAIKFEYDPYYISHPLNCELMLHSENAKKRTKSSISYEALIKLVDEYETGGSGVESNALPSGTGLQPGGHTN